MKNLKYLVLLLPLLIGISAFGQEATFTASVSKNPVGLNENFQLTFTLQNGDARNFKAPSLADFSILSGPNQATSISLSNGASSRTISFTYILQPKSIGKFTIGSAIVDAGGKVFNSNKIPFEVVKGNAPAANNGNKGNQGNVQEQIKDNLFLRASVDRSEVTQGEQVTVTYKLYTRLQITNTGFNKDPSFNGFWKQDLETVQALNFQQEVLNGVKYSVALIKKVALFPQRSGDIDIEPMGLTSMVRTQRQSRSIFDIFDSYQDIKFDYESNKLKIKVKPLPTADKPLDFNGFVGDLSMDVVLDKKESKTDDPITVSIRFNGKGNMKVIEAPKLDLPSDFDIFDAKLTDKPNKNTNVVSGARNYDYLVIPRRPGVFKLPPISVSYFDPASGKYKTLKSQEYALTITGEASKATGTQNYNGVSKEDVQLLGQDIRYIKNGSRGMHKKQGRFFGSWAFAGMYAAPFALFLVLLAYRRNKEQMNSDTVMVRKRGASKAATKRLKEASTKMEARDTKGFYDELIKAIWGYLGDKLNIEPSVLSHDTAQQALIARNVAPELNTRVFKFISDSEMALYAPGAIGGTMESHYEEAKEIIDRLEEGLGK